MNYNPLTIALCFIGLYYYYYSQTQTYVEKENTINIINQNVSKKNIINIIHITVTSITAHRYTYYISTSTSTNTSTNKCGTKDISNYYNYKNKNISFYY